jgi:hypothetical protein
MLDDYTPPTTTELRAIADRHLAQDNDHMVAGGEELEWLVAQIAAWPTRVDERKTTNMRFLMASAAATLRQLRTE